MNGLGRRLALHACELSVDPPLVNARGSWSVHHTATLELRDNRGFVGWGEAAPLPEYSPDALPDCEQALRGVDAARLAELEGVNDPGALLAAVGELIPQRLPAARFALESALLDRLGQRLGEPVYRLLSSAAGTSGLAAPAQLCALLPSDAPERALERAGVLVERGVRAFKLKVGPERLAPAQAATLSALRAGLGDDVALRVDANRSLRRENLAATLAELARLGVEFLEEPLESPEPAELSDSPCPLGLDESLYGMEKRTLERFLQPGGVRVVVLKPTALGGFSACLDLARQARERGCDVVVSHTLEGPIGWAACAHLALALPSARAAGLWPLGHQLAPSPAIVRGRLELPSGHGLGVGG